MAKILSIDDMLEAAQQCDLPQYADHVRLLETAATNLANALAAHLHITAGPATWEGKGFAGLCASFHPKRKKQKCPPVIDDADPGGDWD